MVDAGSFEALQRRCEIREDPNGYTIDAWLQIARTCYRKAQDDENAGRIEDAFVFYSRTYDIATNLVPSHNKYQEWKATSKEARADYVRFRSILLENMEDYSKLLQSLRNKYSRPKSPHKPLPAQPSISRETVATSSGTATTRGRTNSNHSAASTSLTAPSLRSSTGHGSDLSLSKTNVIEPAILLKYLRARPELNPLFLDVRPRERFDECHIDARSVVCIDPLVCRPNIQAQDLEDSFLVAPSRELELFEKRNDFELLVFYDDSSSTMVAPTEAHLTRQHQVLQNLFTGLWSNMGWRKPLARPPMLLIGGLDAWLRLGGPVARSHTPDATDDENAVVMLNSPSNGDRKRQNRGTTVQAYPRSVHEYIATFSDQSYRRSIARLEVDDSKSELAPPPLRTIDPNTRQPLSVRTQAPYPLSPTSTFSTSTSATPTTPDPYLVSRQPPAQGGARQLYARQPSLGAQQSRLGTVAIGKTGLRNLGNSCFMNATIQCLAACFPLARFFTSGKYKDSINASNPIGYKGVIAAKFANLLRDMASDDNSVVAPSDLRSAIGRFRPEFASGNQEDAQELLVFLLDALHEDMNDNAAKPQLRALTDKEEAYRETLPVAQVSDVEWSRYCHKNKSIIVSLLQGQYQSRLRCAVCGHTSTTYNAFTTLSLPIPKRPRVTLDDCVNEFCKTELMEGADSWHCAKCNTLRKASKKLSISRVPDVLLIHFKRFESKGPWRDKINTPIDFQQRGLDMTQYLDPCLRQNQPGRAIYDLFGIVYHRGSMEGGHYTAVATADASKAWTLFDDSRVAPMPSGDIDQRAAYLLFYQKRADAKF